MLFIKTSLHRGLTWNRYVYYMRAAVRLRHSTTRGYVNPYEIIDQQAEQDQHEEQQSETFQTTSGATHRGCSAEKNCLSRTIDRNPEAGYRRYLLEPDSPPDARLLQVSIIGAPNAGKSTLINAMMNWKANSVSSKVHTTQRNTNCMMTRGNAQIVFVDTPGVITKRERKKHKIDQTVQKDPGASLQGAHAVGVIVDVANKWTRNTLHPNIIRVLEENKRVPAFLILNKIDGVEKKFTILQTAQSLTEGLIAGKEFTTKRFKRKKPKKQPTDLFSELEAKYGKLKLAGRTDASSADDQPFTDDKVRDCLKMVTESDPEGRDQTGLLRHPEKQGNTTCSVNSSAHETVKTSKYQLNFMDSNQSNISNVAQETVDIHPTSCQDECINGELETFKDDAIESEVKNKNNREIPGSVAGNDIKNNSKSQEVFAKTKNSDFSSSEEENKDKTSLICDGSGFNSNIENIQEKSTVTEGSYQSEFLKSILAQPKKYVSSKHADDNYTSQIADGEIYGGNRNLDKPFDNDRQGWDRFERVFVVSALQTTGVDDIEEYLMELSKPGKWLFHSSLVTSQTASEVITLCVRQALLDYVPGFLPYVIKPAITYCEVDSDDTYNLAITVPVEDAYSLKCITGKHGENARRISAAARQAIMDAFHCDVNFKLAITVNKHQARSKKKYQ